MNEKILEITKNKDYLTELLSKDTLEEIVEFCKSKGVEINIDDAKEFVELIQSLRNEVEKSKLSKEKLDDDQILDRAVGGYWTGYVADESSPSGLDRELKRDMEYDKHIAKLVLKTTLGGIAGLAAIALVTTGTVFSIKDSYGK